MGISIATIIYLLLCLAAITAIVQVVRGKAHKIYLLLVIIPVAVPVFAIIDNLNSDYHKHMNFIETTNNNLTVELREDEERTYLYNTELDKEVAYANQWNPGRYKTQKDYHVVYLKELENFYMVIYSKNKEKEYTDRFLVGDHERDKGDLLYIINREDGFMYPVDAYSMSGYELDLDSFAVEDRVVYFGVYLKYETGISHYRNLYIPEDPDDNEYRETGWRNGRERIWINGNVSGGSSHRHILGDPSEIETFILHEDLFLYIDSYDYIRVGRYRVEDSWIKADGHEFLIGQNYVLAGYYEFYNGDLYYVSNDLKLMKYTNRNATYTIEENISLTNWTDYIPTE